MPLDQLPEELLLQVALHLPDSGTPRHLKNLSLISRKLRPIAQETLFTTARLTICCGCHPKVNSLVKLLRTLLDRPDLAGKVKALRFRAVRKRIDKLYAEHGFDLPGFRDRCISKLEELGYNSTHPWWRSINNSVESAFGGLLLALLPNLIDLDFWIKDHQRGPPSSECISGLWGGTTPPGAILYGWKSIKNLVTGDTSMLKCGIEFDRLTALDLRTVSIGTALRLNGPGSLQGAENVKDLALTVSIQFADRPLVEKAEIEFSELLDALACHTLRNFKIAFINDGYHIGDDLTTELNASYLLGQLRSVQKTLETLSITLETTDDDGELDWLIDMCQHPVTSLRDFVALKSLVIPQAFIFNPLNAIWSTEDSCKPANLPPNLEQLELLWPHERVEDWAEGFLDENYYKTSALIPVDVDQERSTKFKKLILTCRDDAGIGAAYFTEDVHKVWWDLSTDHGIEAEVHDQLRDTRHNLAGLYEEEDLDEGDSDIDETNIDEDDWEDYNDNGRARCGLGPSEALQLISQETRDQTTILAHLRKFTNFSVGFTLDELATVLDWERQRVLNAVAVLLDDGNIWNPDFGNGSRLRFVEENQELLRRDKVTELMDEEEMSQDSRESKDDGARHRRDQARLPDLTHGAVSTDRIAMLRYLRDLPSPSVAEGLTEAELAARLDLNPERTAYVVRGLLHGRFVGYHDALGGNRKVFFVKESDELRMDDSVKQMEADDVLAGDDDEWEDDNDTDDDMPELEAFDPVSGASIGTRVAPLSRVGLITTTAVLRCVRQFAPAQGVTHEEVAYLLGTDYSEVILRVHRLVGDGHVRDDGDRIYFISENDELVAEGTN